MKRFQSIVKISFLAMALVFLYESGHLTPTQRVMASGCVADPCFNSGQYCSCSDLGNGCSGCFIKNGANGCGVCSGGPQAC
jgi:hypothetical protein